MTDDFELTGDELREVAAFVLASAETLLLVFEARVPGDTRPRAAVEAARRFVAGERRTRLQRVTSLDADRAAADSPDEVARLAARACGDAASAAYLHPIAKAHQVGHLLRAAACEARVAELVEGHEEAGRRVLADAAGRASSVLGEVLSRYPRPAPGRQRVGALMVVLDARIRDRASL